MGGRADFRISHYPIDNMGQYDLYDYIPKITNIGGCSLELPDVGKNKKF